MGKGSVSESRVPDRGGPAARARGEAGSAVASRQGGNDRIPDATSQGSDRESPGATGGAAGAMTPDERARIRIEVLNGTEVAGLADRMTNLLRDRGYDVVNYGNAPGARGKPTVIIDRVGKPYLAREVALALPGTPIRTELSPDGLIDVSVIVGLDHARFFRPRHEAARPAPRHSPGRFERLRDILGL
jgi:hypothetical protein